MKPSVITLLLSVVILTACGRRPAASVEKPFDPRDTVAVPEWLHGEDSIAFIENQILRSPISADDLLSLAEVHSVEERLYNYNDFERAEAYPEFRDEFIATRRDSSVMRLANRFMRMNYLVSNNGDAADMLEWAVAVNTILDAFCQEESVASRDAALDEMMGRLEKFSSLKQSEMNFMCYVSASVEYYRTIESYRQWLEEVPSEWQALAREEYEAWKDLNDARFSLWLDVSFTQTWYSMKTMDIEGYYEYLAVNRRAELDLERDILLKGKTYRQKGTTVTTKQWEDWIAKSSVPDDIDSLTDLEDENLLPDEKVVAERVGALRRSFSRWISARQDIASALPGEQGQSYDRLTADIHARMIGTLDPLVECVYY